jgi:hypothetical protein
MSTTAWPDLMTAALFAWQDVPRLRALVAALHGCLTACPAEDGSCDTRFVCTRPLVSTARSPPHVLHPVAALEALMDDLAAATATAGAAPAILLDTVRAAFLVLFLLDGRVRRFVMARHKGHAVMRTQPPPRDRMLAWLGGCARIDARASEAVSVATHYAEDVFLVAREADQSLFSDVDATATMHNAAIEDKVRTLTRDFVSFMRHWWLFGRYGLQPLSANK